jgi:hypothetical protein
LVSKKPVETRPESGPSAAVARREPQAPQSLFAALASRDHEDTSSEAMPHAPAVPASLQRDDNDER